VDRRHGRNKQENHHVPKHRPTYTAEHRNDVLSYHASTGLPVREVAAHFGLSVSSVRTWLRRADAPLGARPNAAASESPEAELQRLRKENRDLQLRCEILKKTVGIFSQPSGSDTGRSKP